ncbi:hypothetical protein BH20VER2_BH20VER2_07260 [soil metagenome]|nr:hypothetical protein [Chthoniobacterales bacterium]
MALDAAAKRSEDVAVNTTRAVLLVYREVQVKLRTGGWRRRRFHHRASEQEIEDAVHSFRGLPALVSELTSGAAGMEYRIVEVERALTSLTQETPARFWPSPHDTRPELSEFAAPGTCDAVFVFWPQRDFARGSAIPCDAWGLGMGASDWSNGATYAAVANAPTAAWEGEARGEVWLHEWLHGVCAHFETHGYRMPERNADGAELHGYTRSATRGWTDYYRDLMTGQVRDGGTMTGIPLVAWRDAAAAGRLA